MTSTLFGRRSFLVGAGAAAIGATWWWSMGRQPISAEAAGAGAPKMVTIIGFKDDGTRTTKESVARVVKTEEEWRKQPPTPAAFTEVARRADHGATVLGRPAERSTIKACFAAFAATMRCSIRRAESLNQGTGWPSFYQPIAKENILESVDMSLGMTRTAVSCRLCDAHLGHVFDDGPKPTGLRYCMNGVAMRFAKAGA